MWYGGWISEWLGKWFGNSDSGTHNVLADSTIQTATSGTGVVTQTHNVLASSTVQINTCSTGSLSSYIVKPQTFITDTISEIFCNSIEIDNIVSYTGKEYVLTGSVDDYYILPLTQASFVESFEHISIVQEIINNNIINSTNDFIYVRQAPPVGYT